MKRRKILSIAVVLVVVMALTGCSCTLFNNYSDVKNAMNGKTWYYNGGSDTALNSIAFGQDKATISKVTFTGNGKIDGGSSQYDFEVDANNITIKNNGQEELKIPYQFTNGTLTLEANKYFTAEQIDAGIQGCWGTNKSQVILGSSTNSSHSIQFNNGKVVAESASKARGATDGSFYYYGPYEGQYKVNFGGFDTEIRHGNEWFYNIINGQPTILHFGDICQRIDSLPGENGYSF